jgi:hypothetical protein
MNPPLKWYLQLVLDVRSVEDAVAVPKIAARYLLSEAARFVLDNLKFIDDALVAEKYWREHIDRARALNAQVYCCHHACDAKNCPPDCSLRDPA